MPVCRAFIVVNAYTVGDSRAMSVWDDLVRPVITYARLSTNGWHRVECPICPTINGKTGGDTLGIRANGTFHCFRCQSSGRVQDAAEDLEALGSALDKPFDVASPEAAKLIHPPAGFFRLDSWETRKSETAKEAWAYLQSRGLSASHCAEFDIGFVPDGWWGGRIVVPVRTQDDTAWLGFVARDYTGKAKQKYMYPKGMRRSLWNSWCLFESELSSHVLVVEGVFDALPHALKQDTVAVLGKPTKEQLAVLNQLAGSGRTVVVALDGDAWRDGEILSRRLRLRGVSATAIHLPPQTDPGDIDPDALLKRAEDAAWEAPAL